MKSQPSVLRDFTVDRRVWLISAAAVLIGCCAAVLAVLLLRLIGSAPTCSTTTGSALALVIARGQPTRSSGWSSCRWSAA